MHGHLVEKVNTTLDPVTEAEYYFLEALRKAGFLPAVAPPAH